MNKYLEEDFDYVATNIPKVFYGSTFLVTGATGLIGSLFIKSILYTNTKYEAGIKVIALARTPSKVQEVFKDWLGPSLKFIYGDITSNIELEDKIDYVLHTASVTQSKEMVTHPVETLETTVLGTSNILKFASNKGVKAFVYLSSMEAFGVCNNEEGRLGEKDLGYIDLQNVRSCYSEGKRICELMCACYGSQYNLNVKVCRLSQVFGAGLSKSENRVFAQFARSALEGKDIVLHTDGTSWGNYCYTSDALNAIFCVMEKGIKGETYTVVNENSSLQIKDLASLVIEAFNSSSKLVFDIPENSNTYGYAPKTVMKLSSKKLEGLGWKSHVDLKSSFIRMKDSL